MTARFIGSNIYRGSSYGAQHPLSIPRVPTVIDLSRAMGWLGPDRYVTSPRAKPSALHIFHTEEYVSALQQAEQTQEVDQVTRDRHGLGTLSNPVFPEMYRRPATAAGGSMMAAQMLRDGGVIYNPGGGTHHGFADRAGGFCYLNDPVLAILMFRSMGLRRILYVDIDAHHCDGVEAAFTGADDVRMISVHEERRWPFTGAASDHADGAAMNLPLPKGCNDCEINTLRDDVVLPAAEVMAPDAIILQCGADAVTEDPLSRLAWSNRVHVSFVQALRPLSPRFLVLGGGGYNPWSVGRCWAAVWATLSGQHIPETLPYAAQSVLRDLSWSRKGRPSETMLTTFLDAPRPGPVRQQVIDLKEYCQRRIANFAL